MKNLLIVTQKVDSNDQLLGFFHQWLAAFAQHFGTVSVICLMEGEHHLPENVRVYSLGKEHRRSKLRYIARFYRFVWQLRHEYDSVFVHMNPRYVVYGGLLWRWWGKTVSLWYAHGHVPFMLRLAERLAHLVFTSTKEGFRIRSPKVRVVGQGIDAELFKPSDAPASHDAFRVVSIGRIDPVKDYQTLVRAAGILRDQGRSMSVDIIGAIGRPEHEGYRRALVAMVQERGLSDVIRFGGPIPNSRIIPVLQSADVFVNMSHTGSLDKAILEAMSCGVPVITCNEALQDVLGSHAERLMYAKKDAEGLARKIAGVMDADPQERRELGEDLRRIVLSRHTLAGLIRTISQSL